MLEKFILFQRKIFPVLAQKEKKTILLYFSKKKPKFFKQKNFMYLPKKTIFQIKNSYTHMKKTCLF